MTRPHSDVVTLASLHPLIAIIHIIVIIYIIFVSNCIFVCFNKNFDIIYVQNIVVLDGLLLALDGMKEAFQYGG